MIIFTSLNSFLKRFRHRPLDPARDWIMLLACSAIALAILIIWNMWTFSIVAGGGIIGTSATSTAPIFSQESLNTINTIFTNRAAEETKYETGVYRFSDPSQ